MTLKEQLFNIKTVTNLAQRIKKVYPAFQVDAFVQSCIKDFSQMELKERMSHVTKNLRMYLTKEYEKDIDILSAALKQSSDSMFINGSVIEYIERYGCNDANLPLSLEKLGEFTSSLSSEFAIRPFLNQYPNETLQMVQKWATSDDVHKRRLASEGTRPSLPWAQNVTISYKEGAVVLDALFSDNERYVTRSVANHMNDISKIDPTFVLTKLANWKASNLQTEKEMTYIINHSLRTLLKKGHSETLHFLGYSQNINIEVSPIVLSSNHLSIGDSLQFKFDVFSNENEKLIIDYIVTYPTKLGKTTSKTYKLKTLETKAGESYLIQKTQAFKHLSTRTMRPGNHEIKIQINGIVYEKATFTLK